MKWIVLAIVVFVVGYTVVNVYFRKKGPAFRPYEDMNKRATTARLLAGGWQKIDLEVKRPTEKPGITIAASVTRAGAGLGSELTTAFAAQPALLASVDKVTAPNHAAHGAVYPIYFSASLADQHYQLGELSALVRGQEIVLVPTIEKLPGKNLLSRWKDAEYWAGLPTERLAPGRYTARLVANGPALQWTFDVR